MGALRNGNRAGWLLNYGRTRSNGQWISDAKHDLVGHEAVIRMVDNREYEGRILTFYTNSLSLQDGMRAPIVHLALDSIQSIKPTLNISLSSGGVVGGVILGTVIGATVGSNRETSSGGIAGAVGNIVEPVFIGAIVGGLTVGLGVGAVTSTHGYQFRPIDPPTKTSQPTRSVPDSLKRK
jgi:hypothetical protein